MQLSSTRRETILQRDLGLILAVRASCVKSDALYRFGERRSQAAMCLDGEFPYDSRYTSRLLRKSDAHVPKT